MDRESVRTHQQIEFLLLHNLLVNELRLLKRARRVTPTSRGFTANERTALIGRLFRSFLVKMFPAPMFSVSKRSHRQEFLVSISNTAVRDLLNRARDILPSMYQSLQPDVGEIGLLRFDFPTYLTIYISGWIRRGRWSHRNGAEPHEIGIGRHCPAVLATLAWKKRFDEAVEAARNIPTELEGPPAPPANRAQEQLEAVLRAAAEAGRL